MKYRNSCYLKGYTIILFLESDLKLDVLFLYHFIIYSIGPSFFIEY